MPILPSELETIFAELEREGVRWFLSTPLHELKSAHDIDVYVSNDDAPLFKRILKRNGVKERKKATVNPSHNFYILNTDIGHYILDVKYQLCYLTEKTAFIFKTDINKSYEKTTCVNGLRLLFPDLYIITYIAHSIIPILGVTPSTKRFKRHCNNLKQLCGNLSKGDLKSRIERALDSTDFGQTRTKLWDILKEHTFEAQYQRPSSPLEIKKRPFTVVCLGTDGTGKTTLIKALRKALAVGVKDAYLGQKQWSMAWVGWVHKLPGKITERFFNWVAYPLDLALKTKKLKKTRSHNTIIIDRFPGFPFIRGGAFQSLYEKVLPVADMVILLEGDAEAVWQRKKEHSLERQIKDVDKFNKVAYTIPASTLLIIDSVQNDAFNCAKIASRAIYDHPRFQQVVLKEVNVDEKNWIV